MNIIYLKQPTKEKTDFTFNVILIMLNKNLFNLYYFKNIKRNNN